MTLPRFYDGRCHTCHENTKIRNLPIYWIGSEGLDICHPCESKLISYIRALNHSANVKGKRAFLKKRAEEQALAKDTSLNEGTHRAHCCILHGCKYGDIHCPVATNKIGQDDPCMDCDDDLKGFPEFPESMSSLKILNLLMVKNNLSDKRLVEAVGYQENITSFLLKQRRLSKRAALRLAKYFKVSPDIFMRI